MGVFRARSGGATTVSGRTQWCATSSRGSCCRRWSAATAGTSRSPSTTPGTSPSTSPTTTAETCSACWRTSSRRRPFPAITTAPGARVLPFLLSLPRVQAQAGLLPAAQRAGAADQALLLRQVQQAEAQQPPQGGRNAGPVAAGRGLAAQQHQAPHLLAGRRGQPFGGHQLRPLHCRLPQPAQPPLVRLQRLLRHRDPPQPQLRKRSALPALLRQTTVIAQFYCNAPRTALFSHKNPQKFSASLAPPLPEQLRASPIFPFRPRPAVGLVNFYCGNG